VIAARKAEVKAIHGWVAEGYARRGVEIRIEKQHK
jgi:hypothetical protein